MHRTCVKEILPVVLHVYTMVMHSTVSSVVEISLREFIYHPRRHASLKCNSWVSDIYASDRIF